MAIDSFVDFVGKVKGEAVDDKYPDTFHIKSGSFGVEQVGTAGTGTGLGAGKANFKTFEFTIDTQFGSSELLKHCAAGTHFDSIKLYVRKAGGLSGGKTYLTYTMKSCLITDYTTSLEEESSDTVMVTFKSVFAEYRVQADDGELGKTSKGGWDLKLNKEVTAA